jgi:hypothetical protein
MSNPDNNTFIPVASDLIIPGDPRLKKEDSEKLSAASLYANNLNLRINELESAIGQNKSTSLSRAYAIREEASRTKISDSDVLDSDADVLDTDPVIAVDKEEK